MNKLKKLKYYLFGGSYTDKYPDLNLTPVDICGKKFYKFVDDTQMPVFRASAYINALEMLDHRTCNKDVDFFCAEIDKLLARFVEMQKDGKTIAGVVMLDKIHGLTSALKVKNSLAFTTDMIYTLASVIFISENENPYEYDSSLQVDKINYFKEHGQFFFYELPVSELLPQYSTSPDFYKNYIPLLMAEEKKITDFLIRITS